MAAISIIARAGVASLLLATTMIASTGGVAQELPAGYDAAQAAEAAIAARDGAAAVTSAEAAVTASPRLARYRSILGRAYLTSGRFGSAETAFTEALILDSTDARAASGIVVAQLAQGRPGAARANLADYGGSIAPADRGLLQALAGASDIGVALLEATARAPGSTPRVRQNLALAYALAGRWPEARAMASFDLGDAAGERRVIEWASRAADPRAHALALVGVEPSADPGRPLALALRDEELPDVTVAETEVALGPVAAALDDGTRAIDLTTTASVPLHFAGFGGVQFAPRREIVQPLPPSYRPALSVRLAGRVARPVPERDTRRAAGAAREGDFVVQIGAYVSPALARAGWTTAARRWPNLASVSPQGAVSAATGRTLYRLSVGGFPNRPQAIRFCERLRRGGGGCFVRAAAGDAPLATAFRRTSTQVAAR